MDMADHNSRLRGMFHAAAAAYDEEVLQNGVPDVILIHPDLYDYLLAKMVDAGNLGHLFEVTPIKFRKSLAHRLSRQDCESDYSVKFKRKS